jgi:hypothetical protein
MIPSLFGLAENVDVNPLGDAVGASVRLGRLGPREESEDALGGQRDLLALRPQAVR